MPYLCPCFLAAGVRGTITRFVTTIPSASSTYHFYELDVADLDGVTVREALESIGYLGSDPAPSLDALAGYAEIHIEQGRHLDEEGVTIGLVEATWAAQKYHLIVTGDQSHTGSTVISDRHDALLGAIRAADSRVDPMRLGS